MKAVAVTCVGKLKEKFFAQAVEEYGKRLHRFCDFTVREVPDFATPDAVKRESDAVLASLRSGEYVVLADIEGDLVSSPDLSELLSRAYGGGYSCVRFVIGGSCGVDDRVRAAAHRRISFGRVTYPHQLMRVILCEQIYRAFTIMENLPYHK